MAIEGKANPPTPLSIHFGFDSYNASLFVHWILPVLVKILYQKGEDGKEKNPTVHMCF